MTVEVECEFLSEDDRTVCFGKATFGEIYLNAEGSPAVTVCIKMRADTLVDVFGWRFWYGTSSVLVRLSDAPLHLCTGDYISSSLSVAFTPADKVVMASWRESSITCGECT